MSDSQNPFEHYTRPEPSEPAEAHFRNAWQFRKDKNYEGAVQEFSKSLQFNPEKPATHFNLALVLDELKEGDRALDHAAKALKLFQVENDARKVSTATNLVKKLKKKYDKPKE